LSHSRLRQLESLVGVSWNGNTQLRNFRLGFEGEGNPVVSDTDIKRIIILEVGDTDDLLLAQNIDVFWDSFADKAVVFPRLQELYTELRCIDVVSGALRQFVDFSTDGALDLHLHQRWTHLRDLYEAVRRRISQEETKARQQTPPVVKELVATQIETPPVLPPELPLNSNNPWYHGDPYWPSGNNPAGSR
jgi:hypothetical protein